MEEAEALCDRVAIMDHGRILDMGAVGDLVSRRFQEKAVQFDRIDGLGDDRLAAIAAVTSVRHDDGKDLLYSRDVPATIRDLLGVSEAMAVEPQNLTIRRATLEDVFLDLTGRALRD
jgi:ABC-2 type transport system ATP-binding protein